jgi:uncharacterized protein DUF87
MTEAVRPLADLERRALQAVRPDWAVTTEQAWLPSPFHVDGLHPRAEERIDAGFADAEASTGPSPIGLVIQGEGGAGKTHLLGWVRQRVLRRGGYFFLADFSSGNPFWTQLLLSVCEDFGRKVYGEQTQLSAMLRRLAIAVGVDDEVRDSVGGQAPLTRTHLDRLVASIDRRDRQLATACQDTIRALTLFGCDDLAARTIGTDYLSPGDLPSGDPEAAAAWGLRNHTKRDQQLVEEISRVLALTGPSVIAVDQVDAVFDRAAKLDVPGSEDLPAQAAAAQEIAGGLMALRQGTRRTLCLVACLPRSWDLVRNRAVETAQDRFRTSLILNTVNTPEVAATLVAARFAKPYAAAGFTPPHPTWPVAPGAFDSAPGHTPRVLLQRVSEHVEVCLTSGTAVELERFDQPVPELVLEQPRAAGSFTELDSRFADLRRTAEIDAALDDAREDLLMPQLLTAAFRAWIKEIGAAGREFRCDQLPGTRPDLHARLRHVLDQDTEEQAQWSVRAVGSDKPRAALSRLQRASAAAGIASTAGGPPRRLFVLRNIPWSGGEKTRQAYAELIEAGGMSLNVTADDLRTFAALHTLLTEARPDLTAWLRERRPAGSTELLAAVLADATPAARASRDAATGEAATGDGATGDGATGDGATGSTVPAAGGRVPQGVEHRRPGGWVVPPRTAGPDEPVEHPDDAIVVGRHLRTGAPLLVKLAELKRHTAMFAGSGSGKTVLLRRIVEEAALRGVSSIVLDPNNDLARLGDPWPEPPANWAPDDARRATEYHASVEVLIWTPGMRSGRPLSFQPLPDLTGLVGAEDSDNYDEAINSAVETLLPRARVTGRTLRAGRSEAVLRQALDYLTRQGGHGLDALVGLLSDLPPAATALGAGVEATAAELAEALKVAQINDRLFAGAGQAVDPGVLLAPSGGSRARVSVISFVGLSPEQQQGFVNQLQTNLFAWVKRNPARDRPLGGLFVMDEAQTLAPSRSKPVSKESTVTLASMARKYGMGLVYATQGPKDIDNRVAGNANTQFFGKLNSPVQIEAARELARGKGTVDRIARLETGEFYFTTEGTGFRELHAPMCLSHHPSSPLTQEEVLERARR